LQRTAALSSLEGATLRYALHRAGQAALAEADRIVVERALEQLGVGLELGPRGRAKR
jgi:hypothetical protein